MRSIWVYFLDGTMMKVPHQELKQVLKELKMLNKPVLYLYFPERGVNPYLYHDDDAVRSLLNGELDELEFYELVECEKLLRNKGDFGIGNMVIDKDSLWKQSGDYLILVNGEGYTQVMNQPELFYEV
jgi:hypothetical protein